MRLSKLMLLPVIALATSLQAAPRNFDFFITADPQYDNAAFSRNAVADRTLSAVGNQILSNPAHSKGLLVAGDLTQNTRPNDEYKFYLNAIDPFKQYVFDGQGNHDEHEADWVQASGCTFGTSYCVDKDRIISDIRSRNRSTKVNWHSEGSVYSWDWQGVHFIQLGNFGGNRNHDASWASFVEPYSSLNFLRDDLASRVGPSGKPVVLVMHYTFDSDIGDNAAWSNQQAADMWNALEGYNVVAIFSGHIHYGQGGGWYRTTQRPAGATKGPDSLPNIVAGGALNGIYVKASVRDNNMAIERYYVDDNNNNVLINGATHIDIQSENAGYAELVNARSGQCLDHDGTSPYNGAGAISWGCAGVEWQRWKYDIDTGLLHSRKDSGYCLDNAAQRYNGGLVHTWGCWAPSVNQQWDFVDGSLRPRVNHAIALDAYGTDNGSSVGQWGVHGGSNQIWLWGERDPASAIPSLLQTMRSGNQYDMKIRAKDNHCSLEWDGSLSGGERNAKFDCRSNGDAMTFIASSQPRHNGDGTYSIDGRIMTHNDSCGLEWDGSLSRGERNAKFDCSGSSDPLTLTTTGLGSAEVTVRSNNCGLEWDNSESGGERNAKWDCSPSYDTFIISELRMK